MVWQVVCKYDKRNKEKNLDGESGRKRHLGNLRRNGRIILKVVSQRMCKNAEWTVRFRIVSSGWLL